ncbi:MAG: phosphomannomutase/phosphoglucomutase [Candidatus Auribacterota bacterium]|nr:phosphomannomutase/phosphoglucomutase [Candidatus Auribacterota bacterium]
MTAPFKAYDVRGIYGTEITEDLAYRLGRAYCDLISPSRVVVGHDMRPSSEPLSEALIRGLTEGGSDVTYIGLASTDMMYFTVIHEDTDGGVVITASHNPAKYNGFKFVREEAIPMGIESGLAEIEERVRAGRFEKAQRTGRVSKEDVLEDFIAFMRDFVDPARLAPMKVVIDTGNGMGGMIIPELFAGSLVEIIPLFFELDGTFPNHEANPLLPENRMDLVKKVLEEKAGLGIGLDGDTDRAFFVDEKGEYCSSDFILGLLAQPVLQTHPGAKIVYDVRCSDYVRDTVKKFGGTSHMGKVGHAYAKNFMREIGAEFGGEVSGHYYFKYKGAYFDSGNLTALLLLKVLSDRGEKLSQALAETENYHISGEINSSVPDPDLVMERIRERYKDKGRVVTIDGFSVIGDTWWFNVRQSNTEPLVRLNCEAETDKKMENLRDEVLALIRE